MTRSYWPLILVLASAWGASYLFIKVGVDGGFSPGALMVARTLIAAIILFGYLAVTIGGRTAAAIIVRAVISAPGEKPPSTPTLMKR